jgi:hypothetical protein
MMASKRGGETFVAPYFLIVIAASAIPFLLYCLWHFIRETEPRRASRFCAASLPQRVLRAVRTPRLSRQENGRPLRRAEAERRPQLEC